MRPIRRPFTHGAPRLQCEFDMTGLYIIGAFLLTFFTLNFIEKGRID